MFPRRRVGKLGTRRFLGDRFAECAAFVEVPRCAIVLESNPLARFANDELPPRYRDLATASCCAARSRGALEMMGVRTTCALREGRAGGGRRVRDAARVRGEIAEEYPSTFED